MQLGSKVIISEGCDKLRLHVQPLCFVLCCHPLTKCYLLHPALLGLRNSSQGCRMTSTTVLLGKIKIRDRRLSLHNILKSWAGSKKKRFYREKKLLKESESWQERSMYGCASSLKMSESTPARALSSISFQTKWKLITCSKHTQSGAWSQKHHPGESCPLDIPTQLLPFPEIRSF